MTYSWNINLVRRPAGFLGNWTRAVVDMSVGCSQPAVSPILPATMILLFTNLDKYKIIFRTLSLSRWRCDAFHWHAQIRSALDWGPVCDQWPLTSGWRWCIRSAIWPGNTLSHLICDAHLTLVKNSHVHKYGISGVHLHLHLLRHCFCCCWCTYRTTYLLAATPSRCHHSGA